MVQGYSRIRNQMISATMFALCIAFTALILTTLALVAGYLFFLGYKSINWSLFRELPIPLGSPGFPGGMSNGIVGTVILVGLASAMGIPIGLLCGIYLAEYSGGSRWTSAVRFIADVLTGVPSIVVGILGYELIVVPMGHFNGWAGAAALAFIMIPLVARTTEEMLLLVPRSYREASIALGATKARTILRVVLPAATGSVITGIMLAIARVAGETAPLLFTAAGSRFMETNPNDPFPSLTVEVYNAAAKGLTPAEHRQAWAGIVVLLVLILVLNVIVRMTVRAVGSNARLG
ncbi:MAG TPA: phosphate ABC transporter permease PstA [Tepidisphaeraceae bacterium]|nr:phosphate ABC transporter permease PstA [Tepidisphaeraceae bacterium]